jgi:hypothetical protein
MIARLTLRESYIGRAAGERHRAFLKVEFRPARTGEHVGGEGPVPGALMIHDLARGKMRVAWA